jgi:FixJ family two-component response regulator
MKSLGYTVEAFSSAADFLASPHLGETACLIADVHMPAMTGIGLHNHLTDAGYAIPTIIITAHPNAADRSRSLHDGVVCYLRKPVDEERLMGCLRIALSRAELPDDEP